MVMPNMQAVDWSKYNGVASVPREYLMPAVRSPGQIEREAMLSAAKPRVEPERPYPGRELTIEECLEAVVCLCCQSEPARASVITNVCTSCWDGGTDRPRFDSLAAEHKWFYERGKKHRAGQRFADVFADAFSKCNRGGDVTAGADLGISDIHTISHGVVASKSPWHATPGWHESESVDNTAAPGVVMVGMDLAKGTVITAAVRKIEDNGTTWESLSYDGTTWQHLSPSIRMPTHSPPIGVAMGPADRDGNVLVNMGPGREAKFASGDSFAPGEMVTLNDEGYVVKALGNGRVAMHKPGEPTYTLIEPACMDGYQIAHTWVDEDAEDIEELALELHATDPRVLEFANKRAERPEKLESILDVMWERNEGGWRSEAEKRAAAIVKWRNR